MHWIVIALFAIVVVAVIVVSLHLGLTWADRKGWVWYRNADRPPPRSLGLLEEIYQPSVHHMIEEEVREATEADVTETGAPPEQGRAQE